MTGQHVVEFEGVRLTRLPAGRAEGFVWLTFICTGEAMRYGRGSDDHWRVSQHVKVAWPDGRLAERPSTGSSGGDGMSSFTMALRDTGEDALHLTYVDDGADIDDEVIAIPS